MKQEYSKDNPFQVYTDTTIRFGWVDRLKILFGATVHVDVTNHYGREVAVVKQPTERVWIEPKRIWFPWYNKESWDSRTFGARPRIIMKRPKRESKFVWLRFAWLSKEGEGLEHTATPPKDVPQTPNQG